jgi:hypothetical protein
MTSGGDYARGMRFNVDITLRVMKFLSRSERTAL